MSDSRKRAKKAAPEAGTARPQSLGKRQKSDEVMQALADTSNLQQSGLLGKLFAGNDAAPALHSNAVAPNEFLLMHLLSSSRI